MTGACRKNNHVPRLDAKLAIAVAIALTTFVGATAVSAAPGDTY
jgi:hypothetical protein